MGTVSARRSVALAVTPANHDRLLQTIDTVLGGRAVVYGSLPPDGRDIDLLVRAQDFPAIARRLRDDGFTAWNRAFVAFRGCTVLVVELIPAATLALPADELGALFAEAIPLGQLARVAEPAPHHTLLILARRLAREPALHPKYRARVDRAIALDSEAWQRARERARLWTAESALGRLQKLHEGGRIDRRTGRRRRPSRPRRTRVIAVAGADGDRTRFHADSLRESLARLGFDPLVERPNLAQEPRLGAITAGVGLWRPIWQQIGKGRVLIYEVSPRPSATRIANRGRVLGLLAPAPLRSYVIEARRPRDELCEELAEDAWRALVYRTQLERTVRRLVEPIRRMWAGRGRE